MAIQLGLKFIDVDKEIEDKTGQAIKDLFACGEEPFRALEKKVLRETSTLNKVVIATGGGTASHHDNMEWMDDHGITIYLDVEMAILIKRLTANSQQRPLLFGLNPIQAAEFVSSSLISRKPFYEKAAIIVSNNKSVEETMTTIKHTVSLLLTKDN